jgi:hypothetical protein
VIDNIIVMQLYISGSFGFHENVLFCFVCSFVSGFFFFFFAPATVSFFGGLSVEILIPN